MRRGLPAASEHYAVASAETMLALAEFVGVDLLELEQIRRRLVAHEHELGHLGLQPARRRELRMVIEQDIDDLAVAYKRLMKVVERMPAA